MRPAARRRPRAAAPPAPARPAPGCGRPSRRGSQRPCHAPHPPAVPAPPRVERRRAPQPPSARQGPWGRRRAALRTPHSQPKQGLGCRGLGGRRSLRRCRRVHAVVNGDGTGQGRIIVQPPHIGGAEARSIPQLLRRRIQPDRIALPAEVHRQQRDDHVPGLAEKRSHDTEPPARGPDHHVVHAPLGGPLHHEVLDRPEFGSIIAQRHHPLAQQFADRDQPRRCGWRRGGGHGLRCHPLRPGRRLGRAGLGRNRLR